MGPTNTLRKEKVEISNPVWHSGQNPAVRPEITKIGIACVPDGIDEIFLQILNALGMGMASVPVYGGYAKMCKDFELEG